MAVAVRSYARWDRAERAIRQDLPITAVVAPSRMRRLRAAPMIGRTVAVPAVVSTVTAVVVPVGVLAVTTMLSPARSVRDRRRP